MIDPEAQGVRRFRVRVGKGPLPRVGGASPGTAPNSPSTYGSAVSGTAGTGNSQAAGAGQGPTSLPGRAGPVLPAAGLAALPLLDLPPPPAIDGDGKVSVLVQPGRNATQEPPGPRANPNTAVGRRSRAASGRHAPARTASPAANRLARLAHGGG